MPNAATAAWSADCASANAPAAGVEGPQRSVVVNRRVLDYEVLVAVNQLKLHETATVTLQVLKGTATITWWPLVNPITYPTPLGSQQLNATTNGDGSITYSSPSGTVLNAGTHTLTATFTPNYPYNYHPATATKDIIVRKATPVVQWAGTLAPITYGTPLGAAQLYATSANAGTITYNPPAGYEGVDSFNYTITNNAGSDVGTIKLWNVSPGTVLRTLKHSDIHSIAFSPNGKTLASGSRPYTVKLWDISTGTELRTLKDAGPVTAFSPDGRTLASGNADGTIKLWDVTTAK